MNILMGMDTPYKLDKLPALCELVQMLSGVKVAPNKPFVGVRNYTRESGIGADLVIKEPLAMFATDPRYFGRTAEVALGKKSGKANITYHLELLGKTATDEQVADLVAQVKAAGLEKKRLLTLEEFEKMVDSTL